MLRTRWADLAHTWRTAAADVISPSSSLSPPQSSLASRRAYNEIYTDVYTQGSLSTFVGILNPSADGLAQAAFSFTAAHDTTRLRIAQNAIFILPSITPLTGVYARAFALEFWRQSLRGSRVVCISDKQTEVDMASLEWPDNLPGGRNLRIAKARKRRMQLDAFVEQTLAKSHLTVEYRYLSATDKGMLEQLRWRWRPVSRIDGSEHPMAALVEASDQRIKGIKVGGLVRPARRRVEPLPRPPATPIVPPWSSFGDYVSAFAVRATRVSNAILSLRTVSRRSVLAGLARTWRAAAAVSLAQIKPGPATITHSPVKSSLHTSTTSSYPPTTAMATALSELVDAGNPPPQPSATKKAKKNQSKQAAQMGRTRAKRERKRLADPIAAAMKLGPKARAKAFASIAKRERLAREVALLQAGLLAPASSISIPLTHSDEILSSSQESTSTSANLPALTSASQPTPSLEGCVPVAGAKAEVLPSATSTAKGWKAKLSDFAKAVKAGKGRSLGAPGNTPPAALVAFESGRTTFEIRTDISRQGPSTTIGGLLMLSSSGHIVDAFSITLTHASIPLQIGFTAILVPPAQTTAMEAYASWFALALWKDMVAGGQVICSSDCNSVAAIANMQGGFSEEERPIESALGRAFADMGRDADIILHHRHLPQIINHQADKLSRCYSLASRRALLDATMRAQVEASEERISLMGLEAFSRTPEAIGTPVKISKKKSNQHISDPPLHDIPLHSDPTLIHGPEIFAHPI